MIDSVGEIIAGGTGDPSPNIYYGAGIEFAQDAAPANMRPEIQHQTGRRYDRIDLDAIEPESLRQVQRLLRDLDTERRMAVQWARSCPWRRP